MQKAGYAKTSPGQPEEVIFHFMQNGCFPDASRPFLLQILGDGAGNDAAQNAGDEELGHALHADQ